MPLILLNRCLPLNAVYLKMHLINLVFLVVYRNIYTIYYYKTKNNYEVDFCLRQGKNITQLIQVAECLDDAKTREREIRALNEAMDELNLTSGWIITLDQTETIKVDNKNIQCIAVVSWMLQKTF